MSFDSPLPSQPPLDDLSGLRIKAIRTTAELNAAEAESVRRVVLKHLLARPSKHSARFDVLWLSKLHMEMFEDVWVWAGKYRKYETNIGTPALQIEIDLHNMLEDLKCWSASDMPIIEQAAAASRGGEDPSAPEWKWSLGSHARKHLAEKGWPTGRRMARNHHWHRKHDPRCRSREIHAMVPSAYRIFWFSIAMNRQCSSANLY